MAAESPFLLRGGAGTRQNMVLELRTETPGGQAAMARPLQRQCIGLFQYLVRQAPQGAGEVRWYHGILHPVLIMRTGCFCPV